MKKNKWRNIGIIIVLVLLILVAARDLITTQASLNADNKKNVGPDWYMVHSKAYTTDNNGSIQNQLHASHIEHFAKNNVMFLNEPNFIVYDKKHLPWHITADTGQYYQNAPVYLHLVGHVNIKQLPAPGSKGTHIQTTVINYYPDTHLAKTKAPVTVTQQHSIIHAVGMIANLRDSTVNFLSKTHTEYNNEPKHP